jgi:hypothetical protein
MGANLYAPLLLLPLLGLSYLTLCTLRVRAIIGAPRRGSSSTPAFKYALASNSYTACEPADRIRGQAAELAREHLSERRVRAAVTHTNGGAAAGSQCHVADLCSGGSRPRRLMGHKLPLL